MLAEGVATGWDQRPYGARDRRHHGLQLVADFYPPNGSNGQWTNSPDDTYDLI